MPVVNFSDVDAKKAAEDSANVWKLFFSVLGSVCVEACVTVNDMTNDLMHNPIRNSKVQFLVNEFNTNGWDHYEHAEFVSQFA